MGITVRGALPMTVDDISGHLLKQVASTAGFDNVDVMRRAFVRLLGITPRHYRELAEH